MANSGNMFSSPESLSKKISTATSVYSNKVVLNNSTSTSSAEPAASVDESRDDLDSLVSFFFFFSFP